MLEAESFKLRHGLLELIAGIAMSGVDGAAGVAMRGNRPEDAKKRKVLSKGIKAELEEDKVTLELDVYLDYGKDFIEVAERIRQEVSQAVTAMTGWEVAAVDVNVVGVNAL